MDISRRAVEDDARKAQQEALRGTDNPSHREPSKCPLNKDWLLACMKVISCGSKDVVLYNVWYLDFMI